ncbi:MAG: hypothetical protein D6743_09925 [Calditrichaeota bacterium]|nr:MAG: hypothetical protein D6743_09925 [Calditrichota bacterium]
MNVGLVLDFWRSLKPFLLVERRAVRFRLSARLPVGLLRLLEIAVPAGAVGGALYLTWLSLRDNLPLQAVQRELFYGLFFQEAFPFQMVALLAGFIVTLKPSSGRTQEFQLLASLPLSSRVLFARFVLSDLIRLFWIPGLYAVTYLALAKIASVAFVARPVLLAFSSYLLMVVLLDFLHATGWVPGAHGAYTLLTRPHPFISALVIVGYGAAQLLFVLGNSRISPVAFALMVAVQILFAALMLRAGGRAFARWQARDFWAGLATSAETSRLQQPPLARFLGQRWVPGQLRPFLVKNALVTARSGFRYVDLVLGGMFVGVVYLLAMNNRSLHDVVSVMQGLAILYVLLYCFVAINRLDPDSEPPALLYSLPVSASQLYLSALLPSLAWLGVVISGLATLLLVTGVEALAVLGFWLKVALAAGLFVGLAFNCAVPAYPDTESAKKRFGAWTFVVVLLCATFYAYRIPVTAAMVLLSALQHRKGRFFARPGKGERHWVI